MKDPLVAYFCMEFALDSAYKIYSGGLGVLAGDVIYRAAEAKLNLIGVGLAYSYTFDQEIDSDGWQREEEILMNAKIDGLNKLKDKTGKPLEVKLRLHDREIRIQAWQKKIGQHGRIILLDTNIAANTEEDQKITDRLYIGNREHRLLQEMVLGIGGVKMLFKMKLNPDIYHMNEGHSAFLSLALIKKEKQNKPHLNFEEVHALVKDKIVFTNHTLVVAGRDVFPIELVSTYLLKYVQGMKVPIDKVINLGKIEGSSLFSMNMMALRSAKKVNAVSQFHAQRAKEIWPKYNFIPITNGVCRQRWLSPNKQSLDLDEKQLWLAHQQDRLELRQIIKKTTYQPIPMDALILSWARRFVEYKRPLALFENLERLKKLIQQSPIPIYFVFAGKVHPQNIPGKQMLAKVIKFSRDPEFRNRIIFVPNYNVELAKFLVRGSDVWLNTPIEGYEACGTSGMKAGLNGVLQCTTNDGWVREVDWSNMGWLLDNEQVSESLYRTIEKKIIPTFMARDENDLPISWAKMMLKTKNLIEKRFLMARVIDDYRKNLYLG